MRFAVVTPMILLAAGTISALPILSREDLTGLTYRELADIVDDALIRRGITTSDMGVIYRRVDEQPGLPGRPSTPVDQKVHAQLEEGVKKDADPKIIHAGITEANRQLIEAKKAKQLKKKQLKEKEQKEKEQKEKEEKEKDKSKKV